MARLPIRPIIVLQAYPATVTEGQMVRISARLYRNDMSPQTVSRIYMTITSKKDGHTVWPLEVVRKDAAGFDIAIGTEAMKEGHAYLVRISNNYNLSPSASAEFAIRNSDFAIIPVVPLFLSPLFVKKYSEKGIENADDLAKYLKGLGMSDEKILQELRLISNDIQAGEQLRLPIDMNRDILRMTFVTQTDYRVCETCREKAMDHSHGLSQGQYYPEDPKLPHIPVHYSCRCTMDLVYADAGREKKFRDAAYASFAASAAMVSRIIRPVKKNSPCDFGF